MTYPHDVEFDGIWCWLYTHSHPVRQATAAETLYEVRHSMHISVFSINNMQLNIILESNSGEKIKCCFERLGVNYLPNGMSQMNLPC